MIFLTNRKGMIQRSYFDMSFYRTLKYGYLSFYVIFDIIMQCFHDFFLDFANGFHFKV